MLDLIQLKDQDKAKELAAKFLDILIQSEYTLKIKIESLIQLYLSSAKESGIKAYAFERLVQLCMDNNCIDIIIDRARSVVEQSKDWKLKDQDRKSLYKTIANILD